MSLITSLQVLGLVMHFAKLPCQADNSFWPVWSWLIPSLIMRVVINFMCPSKHLGFPSFSYMCSLSLSQGACLHMHQQKLPLALNGQSCEGSFCRGVKEVKAIFSSHVELPLFPPSSDGLLLFFPACPASRRSLVKGIPYRSDPLHSIELSLSHCFRSAAMGGGGGINVNASFLHPGRLSFRHLSFRHCGIGNSGDLQEKKGWQDSLQRCFLYWIAIWPEVYCEVLSHTCGFLFCSTEGFQGWVEALSIGLE